MENQEIRVYDFSREHREYAPHLSGEGRSVEGYAIVFNQSSRVLYDRERKRYFTEVIDPAAVSMDFLNAQDIKLNFNHDNGRLLARSIFGEGSLSFEIDEYGVRYRAELPDTSVGNDVLELIRRGDIFGCSFAFTYDSKGVRDEVKDGECRRTVTAFRSINDFSIVVDPAYWGSYVTTRSFEGVDEGKKDINPAVFSASDEAELQAIVSLKSINF